jgi:hypothetical protein
VGQPSWEDRAASALLRYLLSRAVDEDIMFRRVGEGFEVFRAYGGVEARVDVLKIGKVTRSKAGEEMLMRFVEEAKRRAPDLSGIKKIWHALEWFNTDVSFDRRGIEAGTADIRQAAWYIALFGEPESTSGGGTNVTEEGVKPHVVMRWRREALDRIIAEEGSELESLLGRTVKSWRELVDAIDWRWVLKRVEEMVEKLKPWIGPKRASDAEKEGLARRMLGELELLAHFAEARRGKNDDEWRKERVKRLAKAVEALSGGKIAGDHAETLAKLIINYAESRAKRVKKRINNFAGDLADIFKEDVKRVKGEVWGIVDFILSDMYCLARDCARDAVVRKFVAPALELIMLDKALRGEFDREKALLLFGELYATAIAGDGTVGPYDVMLVVGGELGGGAALLRLATLHLFNQLLSDEWNFGIRTHVKEGRYYSIAASGENATKLKRFLAVTAPSAGGEYLSEKFGEFVEEARVEVRLGNIRQTKRGAAADLTISEADVAVKYNVYLSVNAIELEFRSTDRSRVELAARLLRHAGVGAEVKKVKVGGIDEWYVKAATDMLAAGRKELRDALVEFVKTARDKGSVDAGTAKRWLEKLERGLTLREGWPKYLVRLTEGALVVRFASPNPGSIEREAQRLRDMGLVEGVHFSVKTPEGGEKGYVSILKEGLAYAAWLSVNGKDEDQRKLAAALVELILQRAEEKGKDVYKKALEIVNGGRSWRSLKLEDFEGRVEVDGRIYVVKVTGWGAEIDEGRSGRKLLRIRITAEVGRVEGEHIVDRVVREYTITYSRRTDNAAVGRATAKADAPGGRRADAERFSALIKALTGKEPRIIERSDGAVEVVCGSEHLDGFARYAELADVIMKWLGETRR